ncbi:hypothetical protein AN642_02625 [Epulopiscium sp. SCG-B10WGA-EpuloA2]|nr:hypothetical protein AN642_02625 [Epulopiscium sp. SCG-B10WGA-EpuloA2]
MNKLLVIVAIIGGAALGVATATLTNEDANASVMGFIENTSTSLEEFIVNTPLSALISNDGDITTAENDEQTSVAPETITTQRQQGQSPDSASDSSIPTMTSGALAQRQKDQIPPAGDTSAVSTTSTITE